MSVITTEVEEQIKQLIERMEETPYGDVGLVFTMNGGEVILIKPINLPTIKPRKDNAKH